MSERRGRRAFAPQPLSLLASALALCLLFVLTVINSPAPTIERAFGETSIFIAADRAWTFIPGDCVNLRWRLEGIERLYVDGAGKIGVDETRFCPDINATSPLFEVTARDGVYRNFRLDIHHLPDLLFYLVGFVIFVGAPILAVYYFRSRRLERPLPIFWLLLGLLSLTAIGGWLRLRPHEPPVIDEANETFAVRVWARHDRTLFPHECVTVWWSVVGAQSIAFNGREAVARSNPASALHCAEDGDYAVIEIAAANGASKNYRLPIASQFPQSPVPPPFFYVSPLGITLGALIYLPLLARKFREWRRHDWRADAFSIAGCFFTVFVLHLPFGFDSSLHWESWITHGYMEGGSLSFYATESVSRPWVNLPRALAYLISAETTVGYHMVNVLLYAGAMTFLYLVLRQLRFSPLYAFLTTMLFMLYPVNDALMTLRRLPNNFSLTTFLLATALFLDYCKRPTRLKLLGIWLSLLFCVTSNETGYLVILAVPLLLPLRDWRVSWRNLNLSAIWCLAPAFKLAFVVLLMTTGRDFYQSGMLNADGAAPTQPLILTVLDALAEVYAQTFFRGWSEALATLGANQWLPPTVVLLAVVGAVVSFHIKVAPAKPAIARTRLLALLGAGLLLVLAAIGLLIWLPFYRDDAWRMYMFVPIGASLAMFSLILLIASPIGDNRRRRSVVVCLCLLLLIPAVARLFAQRASFVESADTKARILYQVMEIAPAIAPGSQLAMVAELDHIELGARGLREFIADDMLNSAMHVLYQEAAPEVAYFCHSLRICGEFSGGETIFSPAAPGDLLGRTLVFRLHEDYSVELVEDPASLLGLDMPTTYDASALYDADAALPPRARTMLGGA